MGSDRGLHGARISGRGEIIGKVGMVGIMTEAGGKRVGDMKGGIRSMTGMIALEEGVNTRGVTGMTGTRGMRGGIGMR